jgi:hypothetical protein
MTITRIWQSGYEEISVHELDGATAAGVTVTISGPKTGNSNLQTTGSSGNLGYAIIDVPATRQVRGGMYEIGITIGPSNYADIIHWRDASGARVALRHTVTNNKLSLFVGGVEQDSINNFTLNAWRHIGFDIKVHASAGWAKIYIDGILTLDFEGNTGDADLVAYYFGKVAIGSGCDFTGRWDDSYIDDTTGESAAAVPPLLSFPMVQPNADGNYSQWDGSDGNQTNNYALVDEAAPVDTDYVQTAVADELDSYNMSTLTLGANQTVLAVIPIARVTRESSTELIALGTRLSGTDLIGNDQAPGTAFTYGCYRWERQTAKPGGGAWGQSDIDAFEYVQKARGTY